MLWLIILGVVALLAVVLFRKPPINNVGITYTPSVQPKTSQTVMPPAAMTVLPQPKQVDTFDLNDLFAAPKKSDHGDRPQA